MSAARGIRGPGEPISRAPADTLSDPCDLIDCSYTQLQELLLNMHRATALLASSRAHAELRVTQLQRAAHLLGRQAESAFMAGRADLARHALASRASMLARASRTRAQQGRLRVAEDSMLAAGRRLEASIGNFGAQRETIKTMYARAQDRCLSDGVTAGNSPGHQARPSGAVSVATRAERPSAGSTR